MRVHPSALFSSASSLLSLYSTHRTAACSRRILHFHCAARLPSPSRFSDGRRTLHASAPLRASPKNPYDVLGVKPDASPSEIKKVYFSLARKYHPDTNTDKNAQDKFVEIQEAYDILKDAKKRAAYDQYGSNSQQPGFDPNAFRGASGFGGAGFGFDGRATGDLFEQLFGSFAGARPGGSGFSGFSAPSRGDNLETTVNVSFLESCKGATRKLNINPVAPCGTCSGSGLKQGAKRSTCGTCGGTGTRTFVVDSGFQMTSTCHTCAGVGSTIPHSGQCGSCAGVGAVRVTKTVDLNIPAGVEHGMVMRVPGAGDAPISGKGSAGDLLVRVNVSASKAFTRQGNNLYHRARIPVHTALLGGRVTVPTLDGDVDVRVPSGTQQGEEMVLKGRGVKSVHGSNKGDLFVAFMVQIPRSLSSRQRQLIQQYADEVEGPVASSDSSSSSRTNETSSTSKSGASSHDNGSSHDIGSHQFHSKDRDEDMKKKATA